MTASKSDVDCFQALELGLRELGLIEDAQWLQQCRTCVYTTSSEMLGELGIMVRRIHRVIPREAVDALSDKFADCERSVRNAWPSFTLKGVS